MESIVSPPSDTRRSIDRPVEFAVTAAELNRRFGEIRDRARSGAVTITHHGKPSLVLMGIHQFNGLAASQSGSMEVLYGRLAMIVDNLDEGFLAIDRDWQITLVNRIAEMFLGRSREELVGTPFDDVFGGAFTGTDQARRSMEAGEIISGERSSEIYPSRKIAITSFPMPAPYEGVGFFFSNITERARTQALLRESEAGLAALFDAVDDRILIVLDSDRRVARWGRGAEALLGWSAGDVMGRPLTALLAPGEADADGPELTFQTRDRGPISATGTATPLDADGKRLLRIMRPLD